MKSPLQVGDYVRLRKNARVGKKYGLVTLQYFMPFDKPQEVLGFNDDVVFLVGMAFAYSPQMLVRCTAEGGKAKQKAVARRTLCKL